MFCCGLVLAFTAPVGACGGDPGAPGAADDSGGIADAADSDGGADAADVAELGDGDAQADSDDIASGDPDAGDPDIAETTGGPAAFVSVPPDLAQAGATFSYSIETRPVNASLGMLEGADGAEIVGRALTWEVPEVGLDTAHFELVAGSGPEAGFQAFDVEVNHAPAWLSEPDTAALLGVEWHATLDAVDPDGDPIEFTGVDLPSWLLIDGDSLSGTPDVAGARAVVVVANDGRGGETALELTLRVAPPIAELRAAPAWMTSAGGTLDLFGCCFDEGLVADIGGREVPLERLSAAHARLEISWVAPGEYPVELIDAAGDTVGALPERLLVVPSVSTDDAGQLVTLATGGPPWARDAVSWEAVAGVHSPGDAVDWVAPARGGVLCVEVDGICSEPTYIPGTPTPVVVAVDPRVGPPGTSVDFSVVGAEGSADISVSWTGSEAARCLWDGAVCRVVVPPGASGPPAVSVSGVAIPRLAPATADPALPTTPELTWANRHGVRRGERSSILVRHVGLDHPGARLRATGASVRLVWADAATAVIEVVADALLPDVWFEIGGRRTRTLALIATGPVLAREGAAAAGPLGESGAVFVLPGAIESFVDGVRDTCDVCTDSTALVDPLRRVVLDPPTGQLFSAETGAVVATATSGSTLAGTSGALAIVSGPGGLGVWGAGTVAGVGADSGSVVAATALESALSSASATTVRVAVAPDGTAAAISASGALIEVAPSGASSVEPVAVDGCVTTGVPASWTGVVGHTDGAWLLVDAAGGLWRARGSAACAVGFGGLTRGSLAAAQAGRVDGSRAWVFATDAGLERLAASSEWGAAVY